MTIYKKKISVGAFAKKGEDIKDGDLITIANEGKQIEGTFGIQNIFLVKLTSGEEKNINVNQTSMNALVDAFGEDSVRWVGKEVKVWLIKQNVAGKFVTVLYVASPDAELGEDGFMTANQAPVAKGGIKTIEYPSDEIDPSEIPF